MLSTTSTVLVPGWRWTGQDDGALAVEPGSPTLLFSTLSMTLADIAQAHRRAVAVGDDHGGGNARRSSSWPLAWMSERLRARRTACRSAG